MSTMGAGVLPFAKGGSFLRILETIWAARYEDIHWTELTTQKGITKKIADGPR